MTKRLERIIDQIKDWFLKMCVFIMMVVSYIDVTHYFEINFCKLWYEEAIAVQYADAECREIHTDKLDILKIFESIAKFDKNICYGNILKILAEHNYFWNCEQL